MDVGHKRNARGFTLIELLLVVAIIALLIGILLPALGEARKAARVMQCSANMRGIGTATASYAAEYKDRLPNYSWVADQRPVAYDRAYAQVYNSDSDAARNQMVDIIRHFAKRDDFTIADVNGFVPWPRYTHLVMNAYLSTQLPERSMACPSDVPLTRWQTNPYNPQLAFPAPPEKRNVYRSSYFYTYTHWSPERGPGSDYAPAEAGLVTISSRNGVTGRRRFGEVFSPQQKVQAYDAYPRHFGPREGQWYAYPDSKQPLVFYDASVRVLSNDRVNKGWNPAMKTNPNPLRIQHDAVPASEIWTPPLKGTARGSTLTYRSEAGYYAVTRGGLSGVDTGGREILTNPWPADN